MKVLDCIAQELFYLDGAMGSSLQERGLRPGELPELWNIHKPEEIIALHRAYYEAGCHAVYTNTFGANGLKYTGKDGVPTVSEVVTAAVGCAKLARDVAVGGQTHRFVGLDVGPLGKLLAPLGDLAFEDAVSLFTEIVKAGAAAGADFVVIETMNDSYETKAAVLAAKENCDLPIFVSNVYDERQTLMSGASPEAMVALLEGLGVDVIGLNCSLGPAQMLEIIPRFAACSSKPILVKPNAGLPHSENGNTVYDVEPTDFSILMREIVARGGGVIGGCCGTTPEFIAELVAATKDMPAPAVTKKRRSVVSSYTHAVEFGKLPLLIGERINPTGKKRFKQALLEQDIGYILKEGIIQQEQRVHILDVNVGLPEIDEAAMLARCVTELQGVCTLPLQIDTSSPKAMEEALRLYNGKAMVNSVNGSTESMDAVFPLVQKYGGLVVCLTLDESGIPETAEGRLAIARRIAKRAADYDIGIEDLIFDPLALTISSDSTAALVTLETIPLIRKELGAGCSLGVSNISFGLPNRDFITSAFFTMALTKGLSAAIVNPSSTELQKAYHSYLALAGLDANCQQYIAFAQRVTVETVSAAQTVATTAAAPQDTLQGAIIRGLSQQAATLASQALTEIDPLLLINEQIVPALDVVGRGFEDKTVFLPQLLMSAEAAKAAFEQARQKMPATEGRGPSIIVATVKGDIHDIGKNIVKALLENYGYHVIDLGRDVPPETILQAALDHNVTLVGLSALMTTTVPAMADTITLLRREKPDTKIVVGGAVLTQQYADMIGADHYGKNAMETVRYAEQILKN